MKRTVGSILRAALTATGRSQVDLAGRTGLTPKHICNLLGDKARLSVEVAILLEYVIGSGPTRLALVLQLERDLRLARAARRGGR